MSSDDELQVLSAAWREGPQPDSAAMVRKLRRQRLRMYLTIGLELGATLLCGEQLLEIALRTNTDVRVRTAWAMLGGLCIFQSLLLMLRWGRWRTPTLVPSAFIEYAVSRARSAIRLTWLNGIATIVFAVISLPFVIAQWRESSELQAFLAPSILVGGYLGTFAVVAPLYVRRQRRMIAAAQHLSTSLAEVDDQPATE